MNIFSRRKLRDKFILAFVLLSLAVIVSMGGAVVYLVQRVQKGAVFDLERQLVNLKIREIEGFIQEIRGLTIYKIEPYYDDITKISDESREFLVRGVLEENTSVEDVTILNLAGRQLLRMTRGKQKPFTIPELNEPLLVPSHSEEGLAAFAEKGDYTSPLYYDGGTPEITFIRPILNESDVRVGALRVVVNLSQLQDIISRDRLGANEKGYVLAIDSNRNLVSHSHKEDLGSYDLLAGSGTKKAIEYFSRIRGIPEAEFVSDSLENVFGERVIALAKSSSVLGWTIIAEWPRDDAMSVVDTIILGIIAFSLLAFFAVVILTIFLVRRVTHPLRSLSEGAAIIGRGNFNHRIRITTGDELEELGGAFNKMAIGLEEVERLREVEVRAKALKETLARERQLSKMKDTFISVASHQFRTPLSVIRWSFDTVLAEKGNTPISRIRDTIGDISSNILKLVAIMEDLLTVAEFGLGEYKRKNLEEFDIVSATQKIIDSSAKAIEEKKIWFEFKKPPEGIALRVNVHAIEAVVKNLIDNAITYTRKEEGKVLVSIEKDGESVRFSVEDNGIGIPKKEQRLVFTQFFRASNSVEEKNVGTGLGLYIIKNIIGGHGGKIGFHSEENKGSLFWFTLPLK